VSSELGKHYLEDALKVFRNYKRLGERAIEQLSDEELFRTLDAEMNSVALNVKHIAGNMRSRWTDFLTTDGEKPDRNRDSEFVIDNDTTRADVLRWWEEGWRTTFAALEPLQPEDLMREVTIRDVPHTVLMAINRQLTHYAYHIGQIVFLAKHFKSAAWESLSIPRGRSETVNREMMKDRRGEMGEARGSKS
jgi:hypothetical protein